MSDVAKMTEIKAHICKFIFNYFFKISTRFDKHSRVRLLYYTVLYCSYLMFSGSLFFLNSVFNVFLWWAQYLFMCL